MAYDSHTIMLTDSHCNKASMEILYSQFVKIANNESSYLTISPNPERNHQSNITDSSCIIHLQCFSTMSNITLSAPLSVSIHKTTK